ncbi:hypothetical protein V4D06_16650 [Vibrio mimicus]|uniref:hypothetical protein n=1 Tax=Vibrio mimicus TaxID=674 RepID=UPI002F92125E
MPDFVNLPIVVFNWIPSRPFDGHLLLHDVDWFLHIGSAINAEYSPASIKPRKKS